MHELFALSEQLGDHESAVRARVTHIDLLLELDDLPAADMAIATLDRIATDVRDPRARSYIPLHRARRALMEGRAEEAERLIDEGVKLAWSLHDSTVPILAGAQLFALRRAQGRLGELETAVHQFADSLPAMPAWRCALAVLYLDDGRELEARREVEHLAGRGFAGLPARQRLDGLDGAARRALRGPRATASARARSNGCSSRSRRATSCRPRASSAARSRATWRCARRRAATGTPLAPTWPPRARRPSGCRSGRCSHCSTSTRRASSPAATGRATPTPHAGWSPAPANARGRSGCRSSRTSSTASRRRSAARAEPAAAAAPTADASAPGGATAALRREGDVWRVEYEGRTRFVKDAKGLRHLALLLDNPGVEFHAVDIVGAAEGTTRAPRADAAGEGDVDVRVGAATPARSSTPRPSASTARALEDLRADLEEAEVVQRPRARRPRA